MVVVGCWLLYTFDGDLGDVGGKEEEDGPDQVDEHGEEAHGKQQYLSQGAIGTNAFS
jgi:hypothetical protein